MVRWIGLAVIFAVGFTVAWFIIGMIAAALNTSPVTIPGWQTVTLFLSGAVFALLDHRLFGHRKRGS